MKKSNKQNIHGVLLLDKPTGMSSNAALQKVKWLFSAKKAGHTGSLDPLATGLLPICFGQATKISSYLLDSHKKYETVIRLGVTTDTLDSEGEVIEQREVNVTEEQLQAALTKFRGAIKQVPPMYSALKKDGQPLYKLARKGQVIERPARDMHVHSLQVKRIDDLHVKLFVHCSSGFYIRSLADDLGKVLGCGAHVVELRRTELKGVSVTQAITLEALIDLTQKLSPDALLSEEVSKLIQPIDSLLQDFPRLVLTSQQEIDLSHGKKAEYDQPFVQGMHRFYTQSGQLFAMGEMLESGQLKNHKMFVID